MRFYVNQWLRDYKQRKWKNGKRRWDDQGALKKVHFVHYPRVKVDTLTKVFSKRGPEMAEMR